MIEVSGELETDKGDADTGDLWEGEVAFTSFELQRLTCLFKLDATPKRRPQVSQTKAAKI